MIRSGNPRRAIAASASLDHLVGAAEQREGNGHVQGLGGLEIDEQLNFGDPLHREVGRLVALENPPGVEAGPSIRFLDVATVTHQAASYDELAILENRRHRMA